MFANLSWVERKAREINPDLLSAKPFDFWAEADQACSMSPLALLVYEALLPGSQLVNRLRELGYRVLVPDQPADLPLLAQQEMPLVILVDLLTKSTDAVGCITALRANPATAHIPVIAYCPLKQRVLQDAARKAGANLIAISDGIQEQLPALVSQVLELH
jgi:PleD family two-component response regulator